MQGWVALFNRSHEAGREKEEQLWGGVEGSTMNIGTAKDHIAKPIEGLPDLVLTAVALEEA